jgi:N-acetylmuramoyl-L-alanine amidase
MPKGRDIVKLAARHEGERYVFGTLVPLSNRSWQGPWDCAEFASWCVFQVTGTIFGARPANGNPDTVDAYTGFWGDAARKQKCITSVGEAAATPGAFVLRLPQPGATGHIVISAGDGTTIEAMDRRHGVVSSVLEGRRWDFGILVPGIDYKSVEAIGIAQPTAVVHSNLSNASGPLVKTIQRVLKNLGYSPGPIDGKFGPQTGAAVRAFQTDKGMVPDGEVGPKTAKALNIDWPAE